MTAMMVKKAVRFQFPFLIVFFVFWLQILSANAKSLNGGNNHSSSRGSLVRKDERESLVSTEYGEISAVQVSDGSTIGRRYHLQFITLEPNALFLPVLLHRDMVFYVHTGSGRLSWVNEDEMRRVDLQRGDVYRLPTGTVFFVQSNLEQGRQKLRIYSIFTNSIQDMHEPYMGAAAYSSIHDLVFGFDKKTLQAAFNVPEEVIEEITSGTIPQAIVHAPPTKGKGKTFWQFEAQFMKAVLGSKGNSMFNIYNKKTKTFNILKADPDFQNCNGWSLMVTKKKLPALKGSNIGLLMVNLTKGSMMGPHWNPMGSEISIVTQGRGMVRVVCSSSMSESECKNTRFRVEEGDVFVVPRFHPMAQMAFNNDSLVFVGFSTTTKKNYPQFLVGKASVLQTLDKEVLAASFNVTNTTISQLLTAQGESIILECTSCAEEEARRREEEEAKKREEEEEEARKREEEEKRRKEEEEEARKREEEEARRREEEEERRREEEEERRREEEEARRREEEEEARKREEEEARREEEEQEEEAQRREEEEERRREEEKEAKRREEEEEEQEEEARRKEEEAAKRREEEEARRREEEEEEARREQEEQEEEARRREKEARRREEEEAKRREEEEEEQEEEARREEEERRREEEAKRKEEEAARRREEEEAREEEEEQARRKQQKREQADKKRRKEAVEREEEEARRHEQEKEAVEREEEEARRHEQEREEMERQKEKARREKKRQQEEEVRRHEEEETKGGGGGSEREPKRVLKKIWKV